MIEIKPLHHCDAMVRLPGSKSYTHRALILSALADGESLLINALRSKDTEYTLQALEQFGVRSFWKEDQLHVMGRGGRLKSKEGRIFVGNSGTSMRFLTALASLKEGQTFIDGDERMRSRPIADLLEGLERLGVKTHSRNGFPPVLIESQGLRGGSVKIRGEESSQSLSGLLMVAPYAHRDVFIEVTGHLVSKPYVDITRDVMMAFGVEIQDQGYRYFHVRAGQRYCPQKYLIEGDTSNASYFFSAAAVTRGRIRVENFPSTSVQGDARFLEILDNMGCEVIRGKGWVEVYGRELRGIEIDMNEMPDLVPTLAVTSAFAQGNTIIRNIGHLRLKESDRIQALAVELTKMGIHVEEGETWLKVEGRKGHGAEIETYNDHRIAMSFAIAGLALPGMKIKGEECVDKSFPDFWKTLGRLYR